MASSQEKRCTAADEKSSLDHAQKLLATSPPVMAYVPDRWPDGRAKDVRGWQVRDDYENYVGKCISR